MSLSLLEKRNAVKEMASDFQQFNQAEGIREKRAILKNLINNVKKYYGLTNKEGETFVRPKDPNNKIIITNRANKGGETGLNDNFYKGGQFLPLSSNSSQVEKNRKKSLFLIGRKREMDPYIWVPIPDELFHEASKQLKDDEYIHSIEWKIMISKRTSFDNEILSTNQFNRGQITKEELDKKLEQYKRERLELADKRWIVYVYSLKAIVGVLFFIKGYTMALSLLEKR